MKMQMKKMLSIVLVMVFVIGCIPATAMAAQQPITVLMNFEVVSFDVAPQIINGRTMVPVRAVFEAFGMELDWDSVAREVTAAGKGITLKLTIGSNTMVRNGQSITIDSPATIVNGRTLVPVRAIAEALGCSVNWQSDKRIVYINTHVDQAQANKVVREHDYYPANITASMQEAADLVASCAAEEILLNPSYKTDLDRVTAAALFVAGCCNGSTYVMDTEKYYRSPYGPFVAAVYTCAGATRALGRILDYMGMEWIHGNENDMTHQWCVLTMDGKTGWADGQGGFAGYGAYSNTGVGYDNNPNGAVEMANTEANGKTLSYLRQNGGEATYYMFGPYFNLAMNEKQVGSYNRKELEMGYATRVTFGKNDTITLHYHPIDAECVPCGGDIYMFTGDWILNKTKEGKTSGGVHYVTYSTTKNYRINNINGERYTDVITATIYDTGIMVETQKSTGSVTGTYYSNCTYGM